MMRKKWQWITLGVLFNGALLIFASSRWIEISHFASELNARMPQKAQSEALEDLEKAAKLAAQTRDLDLFEKARVEQSVHFLQGGLRPTAGAALYFYPETLPPYSLERDFAFHELKPGIERLRTAFLAREPASAQTAYRILETRVVNYEGGSAARFEELSPEARTFLRAYGAFRLMDGK